YVAPEIINKRGYDGAKADIWSCGVILFVLLAGYLPFHDSNLMEMYRKISKGDVKFPQWFTTDVRRLLSRLLDPNPNIRITVEKLVEHPWFKKGYKPAVMLSQPNESNNLKDVHTAFSADHKDNEGKAKEPASSLKPVSLNAFDIISLSKGFDLSGLFENDKEQKADSRFMTQKPASAIVSKLEQIAETESFKVKKQDGLVKLQGSKEGRKGQLAIDAEIFEVTPSFFVVEVKKSAGDTLEYEKFCNKGLRPSLRDICWDGQSEHPSLAQSSTLTQSSKSISRHAI
ncbi:Os01g0206700, partial [Oryza sativa Japonica Group]